MLESMYKLIYFAYSWGTIVNALFKARKYIRQDRLLQYHKNRKSGQLLGKEKSSTEERARRKIPVFRK